MNQNIDKDKLISFLINNINWLIIFILPFAALLFKLLYLRRKRYFIEHLIFNLHNHSALLILFSLTTLLTIIINNKYNYIPNYIIAFGPAIYYIIAIKRYFNQSWKKTTIKFIVFSVLYFILMIIPTILFLAIGILFNYQ